MRCSRRSVRWPVASSLFLIARKGGEAFLRKRLHERHVERATGVVRKYGLLSVLVPSLLPPPAPFKIFVLAAGVAQVRAVDFVLAVAIGRGIRYFGEGLLALWYGERAAAFLRDHAQAIASWMAVVALVLGAGLDVWQNGAGEGRSAAPGMPGEN